MFSEKYLSMLNFWILAFFGCLINNESNIYLKFLFRKLFISLYHGQWTAGLAGYRYIPTRHGFLVSDKMSVKVNRRQWSHWKDSEKQFFYCIRCTYIYDNKNTNVDRSRALLCQLQYCSGIFCTRSRLRFRLLYTVIYRKQLF